MYLQVNSTREIGGRLLPSGYIIKFKAGTEWNTHRHCSVVEVKEFNEEGVETAVGEVIEMSRKLNAYPVACANLECDKCYTLDLHYDLELELDSPKTLQEVYEFIAQKENLELIND